MKRFVSLSLAIILFVGVLTSMYVVQPVKAEETIYIRADGSIDPPTAPITTADNIAYIFIDNVSSDADGIVVERNNIVVDGAFHVLQGSGTRNGVVLVGRSNVTLRNLQISAFSTGVILGSSGCVLSGNNITSNKDYGINVSNSSSNNIFSENNIANNGYGIYFNDEYWLCFFDNNTITQNQVSNNSNVGIFFFGAYSWGWSSGNVISGNIMANNTLGIKMMWGENNTVSGNQIAAIGDAVSLVSNHNSAIFENNITSINGNGVILGADWAYHYTSDCTYTNVSRNRIAVENGNGVAISGCEYNTVSGNNITVAKGSGVYLYPYLANDYPFSEVVPSSYNLISENNVTGNCYPGGGIFLSSSFYNNISRNYVCADNYNIYLYNSDNNSIFHNRFVGRGLQVYSFNSANVWDNGYPSGGNYWSDYTGTDVDGDGIGDGPYVIDADNQDRYPLMRPWSPLPVRNMNTGLGYATIQEAIDHASTGDTIFAESGTYSHIEITKSLNLCGESKYTTIIDGAEYEEAAILVLASSVNISNFTVQNGKPDIYVSGFDRITILDNIMKDSSEGVLRFVDTSGNVLAGNLINGSGAGGGINFDWGNDTLVFNNTVIRCWAAINGGYPSYNNTFQNNNFIDNDYSIFMNNVFDNSRFFHNNFINGLLAHLTSSEACAWDNGYPSGGNYWSDYNGSDLYLGEFQTEPGSDGMGDTPYVIDADNRDNYPLMNPWPSGWKLDFTAPTNHPIVDFAVYNGSLYAAADNKLYVKDENSWNVIDTTTFVTSLESFGDKLVAGGQGGLFCYDGTSFGLIFSVSTYIKVLGVYDNRLYAGTMLDNPPTLYYCNGSADNPADWHVDTGFSAILNFSGAFGSIDSYAVYDGNMYVASSDTVYCFDGTGWSVALSYEYAYAFLDMQVFNGKLYLATRDLNRIPLYVGGSGFSGVIIEFDGENWTTVLGHDYWIYSLEEYDGKLYAGTANRIYTFNGTFWDVSFYSAEGAYYAISMINYDGKIYAGMGNGYIFADPVSEIVTAAELPPSAAVPELSSTAFTLLLMISSLSAIVVTKKRLRRRLSLAS